MDAIKYRIKHFFKNPINKKFCKLIVGLILIGGLVCGGVFGGFAINRAVRISNIEDIATANSAKNVIMMIGDGMGPNHLEVAKAYYGLDSLYMETLAISRGTAETFSKNANVTDSAAAATALSTGVKAKNHTVAYDKGKNLQNMAEYAKTLNKSVGIVATETLTGATPSGFSAHSSDRNNTDELALSEFESEVDIFIGAGASYYNNKTEEIANHGFEYINKNSQMTTDKYDSDRIFASFDSVAPYGVDYAVGAGDTIGNLTTMSRFAINYLNGKSGDNGFFIMIEGSYIDKRSHSNDLEAMVAELRAFDDAVKAVVEWANADGDTMVIVTADHETGGLTFDDQTKNQLSNKLFTRASHSSADVYWFVYGKAPAELTLNRKVDNTNLSKFCRYTMANYYNRAA